MPKKMRGPGMYKGQSPELPKITDFFRNFAVIVLFSNCVILLFA